MTRSQRRHAFTAAFAVGIAVPLVLGAAPASAAPELENMTPEEAVTAKASPDLVSELSDGGQTDFWINLDSQADLSVAAAALSKEVKGQAVFEAKTQHAKETQADLIDLLDAQGVDYQSYWLVNTIRVTGDAELLADVAIRTEVESLAPVQNINFDDPVEVDANVPFDDAVAWGVENIHAPEAWNDFGALGDDIVIANIDTGVDFDHESLVATYRGNNGDGTYTHDYNWFDPDGLCSTDEPCDDHGHGSHTMGTMVGSDDTQTIGVAPNARWIAAKGCSATAGCPETALLGSAQWILAPTDLDGNNPDPSLAPDVVNNSWGSTSDDPWFEEIVTSWNEAGIFSSWSNGNEGSSCSTSGSPGIYSHSYSSGAYDVNNEIAYFSSRGPGRDGEVKPNIAAPGVAVISAKPGGGYQAMSGTSMAAPHTAGVVAQIWSAAPTLRGDIQGTWDLLNLTAVDTADDQCGGTVENNNVFGEGRLDSYLAVEAAPRGDTGSLEGSVVSGDTALEGAVVKATAERTRETATAADGSFLFGALSTGDYEVTASKFGYVSDTITVTVVAGEAVAANFDLEAAAAGTIAGVVSDDSGHGWALYAEVSVDGTDVSTFTDPVTGEYSLDLPEGEYSLTVDPAYDGYDTVTAAVSTGTDADIAVPVGAACSAPGYELDWDSLTLNEKFNDGVTPDGWQVVDRGVVSWSFDDPDGRGNLAGGEGGFAIADDDAAGSGKDFDSDLISPVFDLTAANAPVLSFGNDYRHISSTKASVSITVDGGETWTEVWSATANTRSTTETVDLTDYATATEAQVKFTYADGGSWGWWWQVDDIQIGTPDCVVVDGGIVVGNVIDANTGGPLNGATVTDDVTGATGTSVATPDDDNVADGFFWVFTSETGAHDFTAARKGWQDSSTSVDVVGDGVVSTSFTLGAGRVEADTTSISTNVTMGGSWTDEVTLTNTGSAPVTVEISERNGEFSPLGVQSSNDVALTAPASTAMVDSAKVDKSVSVNAEGEWSTLPNAPAGLFDTTSATGDGVTYLVGGISTSAVDTVYAFDHESGEWSQVADFPVAVMQARAAFVDGKLFVFGGWSASSTLDTTYIYDPETDEWSQGAAMPVGRAGMGIGVVSGSVYLVGGCDSTSCNSTSDVFRYDVSGDSWDTVADYPVSVAHGACGGPAGELICAGGSTGDAGLQATYAYNSGTDSWEPRADMPRDVWGMAFTTANGMLIISNGVVENNTALTSATVGYDPATDEWVALGAANVELYRGTMACGVVKATGRTLSNAASPAAELLEGYDNCGASSADVAWLSTDTQTVTIEPGASVTVEITMSGKDVDGINQPGVYSAGVVFNTDTPYGAVAVDVTMSVAPKANMGKADVAVLAPEACNGPTGPLSGVQVQLLAADGTRYDLSTDGTGHAAFWVKNGKYTVIVSKDGWAASVQVVNFKAGRTTLAEFELDKLGCTAAKVSNGWISAV